MMKAKLRKPKRRRQMGNRRTYGLRGFDLFK